MKKNLPYLWLSVVAILVCTLFFFMPSVLLKRTDKSVVNAVHTEELISQSHSLNNKLSILEKLNLIYSDDTNVIDLIQGKLFDHDTIVGVFSKEIAVLIEAGLIPDADYLNQPKKTSVLFHISMDEPTSSSVVWELYIEANDFTGYFFLEEESEKIIDYSLRFFVEDILSLDTEDAAELWGKYLGIDFESIEEINQNHASTVVRDANEYAYYSLEDETFYFQIYFDSGYYFIRPVQFLDTIYSGW